MPNWTFAEAREAVGIHLSHTDQREEEGFVIKEILRTGEWKVIPTTNGVVNKPLRVVRDGVSSAKDGTISLSELVANFNAGVIDRVQIPLSDTKEDHNNTTRNNTGYIRDLWITDEGDKSKLVAKMEFTEPDVKDKVLRGTYADVSCGIPWNISSRGNKYGATLEHVAITNRPFIDGLGPFLAASDDGTEANEDVDVAHFGDVEPVEENPEENPPVEVLDEAGIISASLTAMHTQLGLMGDYEITSVNLSDREDTTSTLTVKSEYAKKTWTVPIRVEASAVNVSPPFEWTVEEGENNEPPVEETAPPSRSILDPLASARRLREIRLSQPSTTKREKERLMPLTREELAALELSDDARAAIQSVLDENAQLSAKTREADTDRRIDELKDLGLDERPGFLKLYRDVMLSDDGGPAVVLSDGSQNESISALEILDRAVEALKSSDEKVHLSDQALASGNDEKPPVDAENEVKPLEERKAEAHEALYGKK